jgi:hypothetical protein
MSRKSSNVLAFLAGCALTVSIMVYQQVATKIDTIEQHDLCHDTKTQTAWIARRNGDLRCFLEQKEFPHRVKGAYLDEQ